MGKKKHRSKKISKGLRPSINAAFLPIRDAGTRAADKIEAWRRGKNPWISVPGTTTRESMVRRRANDVYGDPKRLHANIFGG